MRRPACSRLVLAGGRGCELPNVPSDQRDGGEGLMRHEIFLVVASILVVIVSALVVTYLFVGLYGLI